MTDPEWGTFYYIFRIVSFISLKISLVINSQLKGALKTINNFVILTIIIFSPINFLADFIFGN